MATAQAAENHKDDWGLAWYLQCATIFFQQKLEDFRGVFPVVLEEFLHKLKIFLNNMEIRADLAKILFIMRIVYCITIKYGNYTQITMHSWRYKKTL